MDDGIIDMTSWTDDLGTAVAAPHDTRPKGPSGRSEGVKRGVNFNKVITESITRDVPGELGARGVVVAITPVMASR